MPMPLPLRFGFQYRPSRGMPASGVVAIGQALVAAQLPPAPIVSLTTVVVRIDEEVDAPLEPGTLERITALLHEALADADALLLEDYNKGLLAAPLIVAAIAAALRRGMPVVVDPKYRHFFEYAGATVFKPNRRELEAALGAAVDLEHRDALPQALERLKVDNLLVTLGARLEIAGWSHRVRVIHGRYEGRWELPVIGVVDAPDAVLIRPDGYVAWVGCGTDEGLHEALTKWFGAPTSLGHEAERVAAPPLRRH